GFKCAAQLAVLDTMRAGIYKELKILGEAYPFVPEQLGFAPVPREAAIPKALPEFVWNEEKDRLITLQNCEASGLVHLWDLKSWPRDLFIRDPSASGSGA